MAGQEDDWEYEDEDGEDYSWEYEEDEEEAKEEVKEIPKDIPKEAPKEIAKENGNSKVDGKAEEIQRRRERVKVESPEPPAQRRRERIPVEDPEPPSRLGRSDRNDILEQMKRLQEGMNIEVDEDSEESDYSLSDDEPVKPKKKPEPKVEEDDLDLSDMDLLDPFGDEPIPIVQKNPPTNGHKKEEEEEEKKKSRKHKKSKSKHADKFEKFKKLEQKDNDDGHRSQKIHVRSKDPMKIARQFEKGSTGKSGRRDEKKPGPKPPAIEINKICKICGKEPYVVERLVAEKSWWHKNCFRCKECNKILSLDTYASHQGVIYCKPHHKDLFKPKAVTKDSVEEIMKKNIDFSCYDENNIEGNSKTLERHQRQQRRMETIVRENKPVELEGVIKSRVDDQKWEGLDKLDVGSKFMMFERRGSSEEKHGASDRYGIMEKLKRLQAGEDVADLLAEMDDEMPDEKEDEDEDPEDYGLTEVQKKAVHAEKLFGEESKKDKLLLQRKKEIKALRERLMAGTRDSVLDSFDELNHRKIKKTEIDVRGANAKKFMDMFNNGEVPEGMSASDRTTLEKEAELQVMRSKKRGERDFFKKMESGEMKDDGPKEPKLLIGKLKMNENGEGEENGENDPECATMSKKFSFFENFKEGKKSEADVTSDRMHAAKECKASSVLNKFKDMEKRVANGEDDYIRSRKDIKRFTPPRKLGDESGSEYSDSEYSDSDYSESEDYSSDSLGEAEGQDDEYLRNVREAARAKQLRAKFEEWEATVGEDGGYTNLVDEDGRPLETASKLKNRFEQLSIEKPTPTTLGNPRKHQVKRFKPKEAYEYQMSD